jgi:CrcB protein
MRMNGLVSLLLCAMAGGVGAMLRSLTVYRLTEWRGVALWKTLLLINVFGCAAAGVCMAVLPRIDHSGMLTLLSISGLLGGFTTFSSYAVECLELWNRGKRGLSAAYAVGSIVACGASTALGFMLTAGGLS